MITDEVLDEMANYLREVAGDDCWEPRVRDWEEVKNQLEVVLDAEDGVEDERARGVYEVPVKITVMTALDVSMEVGKNLMDRLEDRMLKLEGETPEVVAWVNGTDHLRAFDVFISPGEVGRVERWNSRELMVNLLVCRS